MMLTRTMTITSGSMWSREVERRTPAPKQSKQEVEIIWRGGRSRPRSRGHYQVENFKIMIKKVTWLLLALSTAVWPRRRRSPTAARPGNHFLCKAWKPSLWRAKWCWWLGRLWGLLAMAEQANQHQEIKLWWHLVWSWYLGQRTQRPRWPWRPLWCPTPPCWQKRFANKKKYELRLKAGKTVEDSLWEKVESLSPPSYLCIYPTVHTGHKL